ncbi:MAG: hypoxanthine phosphoribosyltransferase [Oscillospiraceae bacterium]|nr:hypoxanthine phosphoribosyltransferase [Oscillospiraceae bacterium]
MNTDIERILFGQAQIAGAVQQLAAEIAADYRGKNPLLICVLKGGSVFHADLMRALDFPVEIDFIAARSYGMNSHSTGTLEILKPPSADISGREVILVEDILDTGFSLAALVHTLLEKKPVSLKVAVFLDKMLGVQKPIEADYKCFDADNEFLVGYGLDYAERYRNLPYVGVLKREAYNGN